MRNAHQTTEQSLHVTPNIQQTETILNGILSGNEVFNRNTSDTVHDYQYYQNIILQGKLTITSHHYLEAEACCVGDGLTQIVSQAFTQNVGTTDGCTTTEANFHLLLFTMFKDLSVSQCQTMVTILAMLQQNPTLFVNTLLPTTIQEVNIFYLERRH